MHTRKDGGAFAHDGSDVVASFDAFKIAKHCTAPAWRVQALAPWARAMLADLRALGIATTNRAIVLGKPNEPMRGSLPDEQFGWETDEALARGDRPVEMSELQSLWDELSARSECWNGMTDHYLHERYGKRVYHVIGVGWFVRPEGSTS